MKNYSEPTAVTAGFGLHTRFWRLFTLPLHSPLFICKSLAVTNDCNLQVNIDNPPAAASNESCAGEYACRPRPALHPTVPGDCSSVRVRPRLLHRVCPLEHPGGHGVGLHVPPGAPTLHPDLSSARSSRSNRQFREAQFPVPHHGGRVGEDPEGAGGPAEEDQLPQRGGEQQPDGDEAGPAGHRAEDDREWDQR